MSALSESRAAELRDQLLLETVDPKGPFGIHEILVQETFVEWTRRNLPENDPALRELSRKTAKKVEAAVVHRAFYHAIQQGAQKLIDSVKREYELVKDVCKFAGMLNGLAETFDSLEGKKKSKQEPEVVAVSEEEKEDFVDLDFTNRKTRVIADQTIQLLRQWQKNPSSFFPEGEILPFLKKWLKPD